MSETTEYAVTECEAIPAPEGQKIGERIEILLDSMEIQQDCNADGAGTYASEVTIDGVAVGSPVAGSYDAGATIELAVSRTVDLIGGDTSRLTAFVSHVRSGNYDTALFTAEIGTTQLREVVTLAKLQNGAFMDFATPVDRTLPGYRDNEMRKLDTGPFAFVEETCRWVLRYRVSKVGDITGDGAENIRPIVGVDADYETLAVGDTVALRSSVVDDGLPEGGALTYAWAIVDSPAGTNPVLSPTNARDAVASGFSALGDYTFRLTVSDTEPLSGHDDIVISLVENDRPSVEAGDDQSVSFGDDATLVGTADDDGLPRAGTLTSVWTVVTSPVGSTPTISVPGELSTIVEFDAPGTYVFRLTVSDGQKDANDLVVVTVGDSAPVVTVTLEAALVIVGTEAELRAVVTTDGVEWPASVTWSKVSGPGSVDFDSAGSTATAVFDTAGTYIIEARATDGSRRGNDSLQVEVSAP